MTGTLTERIDALYKVWGESPGWEQVDHLIKITGHSRSEFARQVVDHPLYEIDLRNAIASVAITGPKTGPKT